MKKSLLFILIIVFVDCGLSQTDSLKFIEANKFYSAENILKYAEFLWQKQDYIRSAGEYQRYIFTKDRKNDLYALFQIAKCFRRSKLFDLSLEYLNQAILKSKNQSLTDSLTLAKAATHLLLENDALFLKTNSSFKYNRSNFVSKNSSILNSLYLMKKSNWKDAYDILYNYKINRMDSLDIMPLIGITKKGMAKPYKSSTLSGILSAIIPGTGKIYANRTIDGLYSFLLVGSTSWLAYEGFRDSGRSSAKGWIFGSLSTFLYAGNIYGSIIAVDMYNKQIKEKLFDEVQFQINIWTHF